jgi:hypothetical protein
LCGIRLWKLGLTFLAFNPSCAALLDLGVKIALVYLSEPVTRFKANYISEPGPKSLKATIFKHPVELLMTGSSDLQSTLKNIEY